MARLHRRPYLCTARTPIALSIALALVHAHAQQASAPAETQLAPLRWTVGSFVLVASEAGATGAHYRRIGRWPLQQRR